MSELKKCPFCGGEPVVEGNLVACNNLNCPTHDNYWTDPMIFTCDQWNTRPIEDALNARIAELEHDLTNKEIEYTDLWDDALALQSRIAELEAAQRWIPVSERLPELFTIVLVCDCDGGMETDWIWNNKDGISRFMNSFKTVTHWMSLPQPPEVKE